MRLFLLVPRFAPLADSLEGVELFGGAVVDGVDLIEDEGEASGQIGSWVGIWGGVRWEGREGAGWDLGEDKGFSEKETAATAEEERH